jgi:phage terminase large subunit-like protein
MVQHVGALPDLEDQLTSFQQDGDSPDRADALCYAVQELLLGDVSALSSDHVIPTD